MKKSSSHGKIQPMFSQLSKQHKNLNQTVKKFEGMDFIKNSSIMTSPKNISMLEKTASRSNFKDSIQALKNKGKQKNLPQQYIQGLQDEIKYLEYELKLLKDKEMQKRSTVDQLQKFFDDGIPINENILGMKNIFNLHKTQLEQKFKHLEQACKENQAFINSIKIDIEKSKREIQKNNELKDSCNQTFDKQFYELSKVHIDSIYKIKIHQENNKQLIMENRRLNQSLNLIKRNTQMDTIFLNRQQTKITPLQNLKNALALKEKLILELETDKSNLQKQLEQNSICKEIEDQNVKIKKKILSTSKEINLVNSKIQQNEFAIQQKLKERQSEFITKREIILKMQKLRERIDKENLINEDAIQNKVRQKQMQQIREIEKKNNSLKKYMVYYKNQAQKLQLQIHQILQQKPEISKSLAQLKNQIEHLRNKIHQGNARNVQLCTNYDLMCIKNEQIESQIQPIATQNSKMIQRITMLAKNIESEKKEIHIKEKQIELIKELKSFNLDQAKMIKNSGNSMQENILNFLRKWDHINKQNVTI